MELGQLALCRDGVAQLRPACSCTLARQRDVQAEVVVDVGLLHPDLVDIGMGGRGLVAVFVEHVVAIGCYLHKVAVV